MPDPIIQGITQDAQLMQQTAEAGVTRAQGVVVAGFADAHAFAQHVATLVRTDAQSGVQRVESSHTALVILGLILGAILGAAGMWMALHG